jgi:hypothetical protein
MADLWTVAAERAARWWAGKARAGGSDWREWVGVAWEGIARRAESRARRNLPPLDDRQVHLAARSALVDEVRKGEGGFATARNHSAPLLTPMSVLSEDARVEPAARPAFVVVPAAVGRQYRRWTRDEDRALVKSVRAGVTYAEVASGLGRPYHGVKRRGHTIAAGPGKGWRAASRGYGPDAVKRSQLFALLAGGSTVAGAARVLGLASAESLRLQVARLVRDGALVRTGGATRACRYVPSSSLGG